MAMDGFVSAFHQVDTDDDGIISTEDLQTYCDENQLKNTFVQKWLTLFDGDNDGIIHYDEFCRALGIVPKRKFASSNTGLDEVEIYKETDMSNTTKEAIIKKIHKKAHPNYDLSERDIKDLIKDMNVDHGTTWFIVVNPSNKQVTSPYDFDGKLYYSPSSKSTKRILVWRKDDVKKKGFMCCC